MQLSQKTLDLLEKAGWYQDRSIDIAEYERVLSAEGYKISEYAREFLKRFGGLTVTHPQARVADMEDRFHLNPVKAANDVYCERIQSYEEMVGESLVVIGQAYREHMILSMSESGKVYASLDNLLLKLGNSGFEAIETLCQGKEPAKIE